MDSDGSRWFFGIISIIIFLVLKGFFTACETAVIEISDAKVKSFAEKLGNERKLYELLSKPGKLLTAFSVHKALSSIIIAFLSALTFQEPLRNFFIRLFTKDTFSTATQSVINTASIFSIILIILLTTIIMVVFCDGIPKKLLMKNNDSFAVSIAGILKSFVTLLTPLSTLVFWITFLISKLLGISSNSRKEVVTEEEILMMVDAGNETGVIEESQKEMINNIFEFGDLEVSDVMTHRIELTAVEINTKISEVVYLAINSGRSRIPVYENDIDSIIGIIYVKDLLTLIGCEKTDDYSIKDFLRDVLYVPETNKCDEVFKKLTTIRGQMAVAVDEYGGTAGIVTIEDLLEAIVGNMQDEYDDDIEDIVEISDGIYTIDGTADPEEILEQFGITLPEDYEYDTMGGFIIDLLGRIPNEDENPTVTYQNVEFTVLLTEDKRVSKIKAEFKKPTEQ